MPSAGMLCSFCRPVCTFLMFFFIPCIFGTERSLLCWECYKHIEIKIQDEHLGCDDDVNNGLTHHGNFFISFSYPTYCPLQ